MVTELNVSAITEWPWISWPATDLKQLQIVWTVQDFEDFVLVRVCIDFQIVLHSKRNIEEFQKSNSGDPTIVEHYTTLAKNLGREDWD